MFSKWIRSEVLPAIRKTGHYEMPGRAARPAPEPSSDYSALFQELVRQGVKLELMEREVRRVKKLAVKQGLDRHDLPGVQQNPVWESEPLTAPCWRLYGQAAPCAVHGQRRPIGSGHAPREISEVYFNDDPDFPIRLARDANRCLWYCLPDVGAILGNRNVGKHQDVIFNIPENWRCKMKFPSHNGQGVCAHALTREGLYYYLAQMRGPAVQLVRSWLDKQ